MYPLRVFILFEIYFAKKWSIVLWWTTFYKLFQASIFMKRMTGDKFSNLLQLTLNQKNTWIKKYLFHKLWVDKVLIKIETLENT